MIPVLVLLVFLVVLVVLVVLVFYITCLLRDCREGMTHVPNYLTQYPCLMLLGGYPSLSVPLESRALQLD